MSNYLTSLDGAPGGLGGGLSACLQRNDNDRDAVAEFRAAGPLTEDAQEFFDDAVVSVARERLTIVNDLIEAGLTFDLPNWLSVMELDWEAISDPGVAQRTMIPGSRGENQLVDRERKTLPIYATMDDFSFNIRLQRAAERAGTPLDTTMVEVATRRVNEAIEDAAINGLPANVASNQVRGLVNAENVNTDTFVDNEAWDASGHSGQDIRDDVFSLIDALQADNFFGPYWLYMPTTYDQELNKLYTDGTTTQGITTRELLMQVPEIERISAADRLRDESGVAGGSDRSDTVIMFQATSDVVDVVVGQQPTPVSWSDGPGWNLNNVVLACICPRVRNTYSDQSGIVVGTPS